MNMKTRYFSAPALLASSGLLVLTNVYAKSSAPIQNIHNLPIQITLQQAIDENCDGLMDASKPQATINACIIYTITATNMSDSSLFNIRLSGNIPPETQLYTPLSIIKNNSAYLLPHQIGQEINDDGIPTVYALFDYLGSGKEHSITLQYSVRIRQNTHLSSL